MGSSSVSRSGCTRCFKDPILLLFLIMCSLALIQSLILGLHFNKEGDMMNPKVSEIIGEGRAIEEMVVLAQKQKKELQQNIVAGAVNSEARADAHAEAQNGSPKKENHDANPTKDDPGKPPVCYRQNLNQPARCPNGRHSIIYWNVRQRKGAGIADIKGKVGILGNLAEYVCARLILPPPSEFLSLEHNRGHRVPEEAKWKDYFRVTTKFKENEDAYDDNDEALVVREDLTLVQVAEFASSLEQKNASRHMILTGPGGDPDAIARTAMDQLNSALDFVKDDITFAWRMDRNPYTFVRPLMELAQQAYGEAGNSFFPYVMSRNREEGNRLDRYGCVYMRWEYSHVQRKALEEFRRLAGLVRASDNAEQEKVHYAYLHVRRFDVGGVPTCDSSKETMGQYLKCSLKPCPSLPNSGAAQPRLPVVVFSDETNQTYLEELYDVVSQYTPPQGVVRGDKTVMQALSNVAGAKRCEHDNFLGFSVQVAVWLGAAHTMKRHRNWCNSCDPLECKSQGMYEK